MKAPHLNDLDSYFQNRGGHRHPHTRTWHIHSLGQRFPNCVLWNTRAVGFQGMLCKKQRFCLLFSELAQEIKVGQSSSLRIFSEPLTMATSPTCHLTPPLHHCSYPHHTSPCLRGPNQATSLPCSEAPETP